ncbi:phage portal protein [Kribbella sp. CA-293567]|uniref:phage portal protein n=1 Tax=Kribbella sp. CA-293567 TaxID=3002436 RepID=UPI0022DDF1AD|nr:phage portal protein [Kribbella sp. CA-293567]WBQ02947.1 phage portal protein [Kribbella sp. CA-293567]
MGLWGRLTGRDAVVAHALATGTERRFAVDAESIPAQVFGLESYADPIAPAPRISRREAIQVPAVKRSRDLIAGSIGQLPLNVYDSERVQLVNDLLPQPERNRGRTVTLTATVEDLLFERIAWWRVVERTWEGYPRFVRRVDPCRVDVDEDKGEVRIDGETVPDRDLIRFDSPNDALLIAGARAIRTCLRLDAAAARSAESPMPQGVFTPAEGADPVAVPTEDDPDPDDDAAIREMLNAWKTARQAGADAYLPASLKYNPLSWNPKDLQLAEARQHAVLEIARVAGVDPEELGVSTTSRTYANQFDRRKAFIDFTLGSYLRAIEDRLSMGDVTKRGNYVRFNLDAFLRSDTLSRWQSYKVGLEVGAITRPEIRDLEDKPALTEDQMSSAGSVTRDGTANQDSYNQTSFAVPSSMPASKFDAASTLELTAPAAVASFKVDQAKRTITGLAVPFGVVGSTGGTNWTFSRESIVPPEDVSRVKLLMDHSFGEAVGYCVSLDVADNGITTTFKVAATPEGDRALQLAQDRVYDGLSVGLGYGGELILLDDETATYKGAPLLEVSLTPLPAFSDARVTAVAASAAPKEGTTVTETKVNTPAEGSATNSAEQPLTFSKEQHDALLKLLGGDKPETKPAEGPQVISASEAAASFSVKEEAPYRFDGRKGKHDFSTDLFAGARGDSEALQRATTFTRDAFLQAATFDVDSGNVASLNPARQRPEMYVDQKAYVTPFYDALYKGTLADQTPFTFPKFTSASGLVADHVEGVEPTPGTFVAGSQTVTPTALSGKVEITREVFDAGGNPQVSTLIWNKMVRAWYEGLEAKAVALLDAASPTGITLTTNAVNAALVNELEAAIAALQFIRGGNTFNFAGTHVDLYLRLAAAVDTAGRKLLPILGATNANGQARPRFSSLDVAGVEFAPAWSLGAAGAVAESSYLVDTNDVHVWNTAPQRLEFQYRVAYVDLAIWGYCAAAISDLTGVREVIYDPTT